MADHAHALPRPGPLWGPAPMRPPDAGPTALGWPRWGGAAGQARRVARRAARQAERLRRHAAAQAADPAPGLARLRAALRTQGFTPAMQAQALGCAAAAAARTLGQEPYGCQLFAAAALLDGRMVEMATGEGKTLATALAAGAAALAGMPVHVVTSNDYLAGRDATALAPLYRALGLRVAHLAPTLDADARRAVYGHDIVYATARDLAFDHLRDQLELGPLVEPLAAHAATLSAALQAYSEPGAHTGLDASASRTGPTPMQRGLCLALLDEADSILLDEAETPLVLSTNAGAAAAPAQRAQWFQALALARRLQAMAGSTHGADADYRLWPAEQRAELTAAGTQRLAQAAAALPGLWQRPAWRDEMVCTALTALHLLERDRHYLVRDGSVVLLDAVTGRAAPGRVWSRGLHTLVALKEGLKPEALTDTLARTTYQRFFQRYWHLAGLSGTLWEARAELKQAFGLTVVRVPLHRPCRRQPWPARVFDRPGHMHAAAVQRARQLHAQGRPVLIGTDSVAASAAVAQRLAAAGLPHRVLDALHDADEAATVAAAGAAGAITVATRMAGRGTDIALDPAALAAGGLHVINAQRNPSPRLDRQLAGRAARHGDPGSTERLLCRRCSDDPDPAPAPTLLAWTTRPPSLPHGPAWMALATLKLWQWQQERQARARRRQLQDDDRASSRRLSFSGPDQG